MKHLKKFNEAGISNDKDKLNDIKKAAEKYSGRWGTQDAFIDGAMSDSAKEYWYEKFKNKA